MKKIKIAFVLDTMIYGGIERVAINYLKDLDPNIYDIDVFVLDNKTEEIINDIPEYCKIIKWNISRKMCPEAYWRLAVNYNGGVIIYIIMYVIMSILKYILKLIAKVKFQKYDLSIAFSGHYNDLYVAGQVLNTNKKIAWLHGALYSYLCISPAFLKLYKKFDKLIVLSELAQYEMELLTPELNGKICKLWNPVQRFSKENILECKVSELNKKYGEFILMVGRMNCPKDYITVIDAMTIINKSNNKNINAVFLGDGPDRSNIEEYIKIKNMNDCIFIEGNVHDVENYYQAAKILVHSSLYEGLPTVLLEGMSTGLPVVATDSLPGVREILNNNEYGLICNIKDSKNMAKQILSLYDDKDLYRHYSYKAMERIEHFEKEKIILQFENIIGELL